MPVSAAPPSAGAVEALLTGSCQTPARIERWQRIEPWSVARVRVVSADAEWTAIVKWGREGVGQARAERWRLSTEVAALRFLSEDLGLVDPGLAIAPRVIAADLSAGFLVLEDLAPRVALDRLICRDGAAAHRERLAAFARTLGELAAATAGRADVYRARCTAQASESQTACVAGAAAAQAHGLTLWERAGEASADLDVALTGQVRSELIAVLDELDSPGPFLCLSNGDAEANNVLVRESGPADARLIDFEAAGYGHALRDAVCLHVPGPRWLSVGDPALGDPALGDPALGDPALGEPAVEYRRALADAVPEAQEDRRYGFALAGACAAWALLRLQRLAALDRRPPGHGSRIQLVETLEAAARTAAAHHVLPHLAGWFRRAADVLRRRWPDTDLDLADFVRFPPYRPRE